ncbi:DUF4365 domain-containing protein [Pseudomonas putida]|uniref:DUF4365 domain-containing protein n=1 Tax=Pseudomonas putida TaxID=303 RepID=UPI001E39E7C6|nr:DUF4365 domain-containing protein [Pseudomonas putida]MCE0975537.1 DUF4365 domain-containing protein [Pseudomonas putida]
MPVEGPLPERGDQHDINADADRCLRGRCPRHWRVQSLEGTDDYGYGYQVQTTPGQQATDIFRIQLKGTRSPQISADNKFISICLSASTIRYYDRAVEPVLLVICDLSVDVVPLDCPLYYVWIRDELRRINVADLPVEQKYVTLKASLANRLNTKTDLAADILHQNEYSRAGHVLVEHTEQTHPLLRSDERLSLVQGAMQGIAARGAKFIEALAAPVEGHRVNPPRGSLAWELSQARSDQEVNELERTRTHLDSAERMLQDATVFKKAEYWGLRGNWYVECGLDSEASSAYQCAHQFNPLSKYRAAWVEAEIRCALNKDAPDQALRTATLLIIHAGNMGPLENVLAERLWRVYFVLAGWHQGYLDNPKVALVVRHLGVECAQVPDQREGLYSALSNCLGQGTIEAIVFASTYSTALTQYKTRT